MSSELPEPGELTAGQVEVLRRLAAGALDGRRGRETPEVTTLVALGLARSTWEGHAGMQLGLTEKGEQVLAALERPSTASVYEVPSFMAELTAFLERWLPAVGEERALEYKRNLAYLIDLAAWESGQLERERLRGMVASLIEDELIDEPTLEAALEAVSDPAPRPLKGRSSRVRA